MTTTNNKQPLYRAEALAAHRTKWLGEIILIRPTTYKTLTLVAVICALIVILFMAFFSYTKRSTVVGQLMPVAGLVKVYAPQVGIVQEKRVIEGQPVKKGDVLYVLSSERYSSAMGSIQESISKQVEYRRDSLRDELDKTKRVQEEERKTLTKRVEALRNEVRKLDAQVEGQRRRVKLAEDTLERYQGLLAQDYISREQAQQKEEELLDQRFRLEGMERERISVNRELVTNKNELAGLEFKHQKQLAPIERGIASTTQELTESEAKRHLEIIAPEGGIATSVMAAAGQAVDGSRPLLSIVPAGAKLVANLYAPSSAIGFIKPGDTVLMRYQAYPYQKFGQAKGEVISVSKSASPANELMVGQAGGGQNSEPLYTITVKLASQTIDAYGKKHTLQAGMMLDADVMHEKRRLYEWVLEPLISLTGKL